MPNLLITGVAAGNTTIHAKRRSTGETVDIACTVSAGVDPLNATTGQGVMGAVATATPVQWDAARVYSGAGYASPDAQWRATRLGNPTTWPALSSTYSDPTKTGSATGSPLYRDGRYVDLLTLVTSGLIAGGVAVFRGRIPGNDGSASEPATPELGGPLPSSKNYRRLWFGREIVYLAPGAIAGATLWDITGSDCVTSTSINYNATEGASAFKNGPFLNSTGGDPTRYGIECGHYDGVLDSNGHHYGDVVIEAYSEPGGSLSGPLVSPAGRTNVDGAYWDQGTYHEVILAEFRVGSDGHDYASIRYFRRHISPARVAGPWYAGGCWAQSPKSAGGVWYDGEWFTTWMFTSKNHNRAVGGDRDYEISEWALFDAENPSSDGSDDPWGCLAAQDAATPVVPQKPTLSSQTSTTATFSVSLVGSSIVRSYIARLRPVIDGIDAPSQDRVLLTEEQSDVGSGAANLTHVSVTLTLTTGLHSVAFKGVNGNNTVASAASGSVNVTI